MLGLSIGITDPFEVWDFAKFGPILTAMNQQ